MTRLRIPQGVVYILVGLATTGVHVGLALAARTAGLSPLAANFAGYATAVVFSYFGHALLTFRQHAWKAGQFVRFVVVSLFGLGLNQAIVHVSADRLHLPFWLSLVFVVLGVPPATFLLSKLWAFRQEREA